MGWQGAAVAMRLADHQNEAGDPHRFLELIVDRPDAAFKLAGRFITDPEMQQAPDGIAWQMTGDTQPYTNGCSLGSPSRSNKAVATSILTGDAYDRPPKTN